jgi:hypothetical protein
VGRLSAKPEKALAPVNLEGAVVGVGYVQGCGGDYFSYNELVGAVEDIQKVRQNSIIEQYTRALVYTGVYWSSNHSFIIETDFVFRMGYQHTAICLL